MKTVFLFLQAPEQTDRLFGIVDGPHLVNHLVHRSLFAFMTIMSDHSLQLDCLSLLHEASDNQVMQFCIMRSGNFSLL